MIHSRRGVARQRHRLVTGLRVSEGCHQGKRFPWGSQRFAHRGNQENRLNGKERQHLKTALKRERVHLLGGGGGGGHQTRGRPNCLRSYYEVLGNPPPEPPSSPPGTAELGALGPPPKNKTKPKQPKKRNQAHVRERHLGPFSGAQRVSRSRYPANRLGRDIQVLPTTWEGEPVIELSM